MAKSTNSRAQLRPKASHRRPQKTKGGTVTIESKHQKIPTSASKTVRSQLFLNNPLPMWVYDLETLTFLDVNHAAIDKQGYSREKFLQMRITEIHPAEDVPRLLQDINAIRPSLQYSKRWRHLTKNGAILDVEITSHVIDFEAHRAALVVVQDITNRKWTEEQVSQLAAIVENSQDAILSKSLEGIILSWNSDAKQIYGYLADEIIGQPVSNLMPPERKYEMLENLSRIGRGEEIKNFETKRMRKDSNRIIISVTLSPIRNEEGK